jgi:hypothetical protein
MQMSSKEGFLTKRGGRIKVSQNYNDLTCLLSVLLELSDRIVYYRAKLHVIVLPVAGEITLVFPTTILYDL